MSDVYKPVIAIVNPKGGTGKTTLTLNLADCLALQGYDIEVFDVDTQQQSLWKLHSRNQPSSRLFQVRKLDNEAHYASLYEKTNANGDDTAQNGFIIIDTGSNPNPDLLEQVLIDSDIVLVPFLLDVFSIHAFEGLLSRVNKVINSGGKSLKIRLLPNHILYEDAYFSLLMDALHKQIELINHHVSLDMNTWFSLKPYSPDFENALIENNSVFIKEGPAYKEGQLMMQDLSSKVLGEIEYLFFIRNRGD